jgi:tyrosyl-tRNA synthetase
MQNALDVLKERGFVQQVTDEATLRGLFAKGAEAPVVAYVGIDPTAESMHAGHLLPLMAMMHLERAGHRPLIVLGGGTAMVGDPSGKSEMRQLLEEARIRQNLARLRDQISQLFDVQGGRTTIADNGDWLLGLNYVAFLRDIGRHFSVNRMLAAEAYKLRLERGLSFIEFNYQLLQAYDFLELYRRHRCVLQVGGDDQWGNILAGVDLVRRLESAEVYGLTFPLLLTATGEKMGKTAGGAVWLDPEKLSAYDYYQYWVNTHDADVVKLLGFFTFLPMDEVRQVATLRDADLNVAKSVLAFEATTIVHGADAAASAHRAAQAAFGGRPLPAHVLPSSQVARGGAGASAEIPTTELPKGELEGGMSLAEVLVRTGLADSKNEARRLITQGGVRLEPGGGAKDPAATIDASAFADGVLTLRVGKKKVHRLRLS